MTIPWPKIETALISTALHFGFSIREDTPSGDKFLEVYTESGDGPEVKTELNLTEAAKVLEQEL